MQYHPRSTHILIRHHEISLKGRNRPDFERLLVDNIQRISSRLSSKANKDCVFKVQQLSGRYLLSLQNKDQVEELIPKIANLGGIAAVSHCQVTNEFNPEEIIKTAVEWFDDWIKTSARAESFAVRTRRVKQNFSLPSTEMDKKIGSVIHSKYPHLKVDLKNADLALNIEIRNHHVLVYGSEKSGALGLPMDTSQRVVCLLSGGIDSPVAAFELMARGCSPVFVHFHSQPFTSEAAVEKVKRLAKAVANNSPYPVELWLVPLLEIQKTVRDNCNERYRTVHYRRFMLKIAEELARKRWAKAIVTGEALGQVASQTLTNIAAIENGISIPILRPLISLNKVQIVEKAKKLGTYEISLEPHEDTCVLFAPKKPATQARLEYLKSEEDKLPVYSLVFSALDRAEKILL